jgi:scyllo-inositol 2-dehydrogenase (NADP+)
MSAVKRQRCIVVGYGVQGRKRQAIAGADVAAIVDPVAKGADYKDVRDVPLKSYDAALVCTPDAAKYELLSDLLGNGKHVLVEKPLLAANNDELLRLQELARQQGAVCYTAYNHRFEPHFMRMRDLIATGELGRIYSLRMFYGNGTARLVRESGWRDRGAGVLPDLGSHLIDTLLFWLPDAKEWSFRLHYARCHENAAFDHVLLDVASPAGPVIQLEMTLLSWRNHFTAEVIAECGSAHIESLCKWGPSEFTRRRRILPSGRPPEERAVLVQDDPTWASEYDHFLRLCAQATPCSLENDIWINRVLHRLAQDADLAGAAG